MECEKSWRGSRRGVNDRTVFVYEVIKNNNLNLKMMSSANDTLLSKQSDWEFTDRRNQKKLKKSDKW